MALAPSTRAIDIFYSYAHEDEQLRDKLDRHLAALRRQGHVRTWHDRMIPPGSVWANAIDARLDSAQVILLLISPAFLDSDYCYDIEMQRALERSARGEARVIPILLKPVDWQGTSFAHLQMVPRDARAVTLWRNQDEAWLDVVRGIRAVIEEMDCQFPLPASAAALPCHIPYRRNRYFTGHEQLFTYLQTRLMSAQNATGAEETPLALQGLAGSGKTQIALEYAYRQRDAYGAVLWVTADTPATLLAQMAGLAGVLNLSVQDLPETEQALAAVLHWLETHTGWLLIFDNVEDPSLLHTFLPATYHGHVLLTTRVQALGTYAKGRAVPALTPAESALFLLQRARILARTDALEAASTADSAAALELACLLAGLPLALDQAGAYIEDQLVQEVVREGMSEDEELKWIGQMLKGVNHVFPNPIDSITWSCCEIYVLPLQFLHTLFIWHTVMIPEAAYLFEPPFLHDSLQAWRLKEIS